MDPKTAAILILISSAECSLLFFASAMIRRGKANWSHTPSLCWGSGTAVYVIGLTILLARGGMSPWLGVVLSNALLVLGLILIIVGLRVLIGRGLAVLRFAASWLVYILLSMLFTFVFHSVSARIVLISCFIAAIYLEGVFLLLAEIRKDEKPNPFAPILAVTFFLQAVFFLFRGAITILYPQSSVFTPNAVNATTFIVSHFGLIAWGLGLILTQNLFMERDLEKAYAEKEILLRELQHRVKNSISVISSLISLESSRGETPEIAAVLDGLKGRIDAIGTLYDKLFASDAPNEIELDSYLQGIAASLWKGHAAERRGIALELALSPLRIDAKRAGSIGIIVNELLTNSFKYAFPGGKGGTVILALDADDQGIRLEVGDDGVGLPPGAGETPSRGLGLILVETLALQIGATLASRTEGGARFVLRFPAAMGA